MSSCMAVMSRRAWPSSWGQVTQAAPGRRGQRAGVRRAPPRSRRGRRGPRTGTCLQDVAPVPRGRPGVPLDLVPIARREPDRVRWPRGQRQRGGVAADDRQPGSRQDAHLALIRGGGCEQIPGLGRDGSAPVAVERQDGEGSDGVERGALAQVRFVELLELPADYPATDDARHTDGPGTRQGLDVQPRSGDQDGPRGADVDRARA